MPDEPNDVVLYPFRFKDPITGRWVRARYRASLEDIAARYAEWDVTGEPVTYRGNQGHFSPFRK